MDLGCGDLSVTGTYNLNSGTLNNVDNVAINTGGVLNGDSGILNMSGDWTNNGTFNAGTSTVNMIDGCGVTVATITGNTTFNNLTITSSSGRQINFPAGSTQTVTGAVNFAGAAGVPLKIRSTTPGTPANLDFSGASPQSFSYLDIKDNTVSGLTSKATYSLDSGNLLGWLFLSPAAIPTLSRLGVLLLALLLSLPLLWRGRPERFQA